MTGLALGDGQAAGWSVAPSDAIGVRGTAAERLTLIALALAFTLISQYVYVHVLVSAGMFDYMGLRAAAVPEPIRWAFVIVAVAPAAWLPLDIRRPTDIAQLFLYFAVNLQTAALMPYVSLAPLFEQFAFCVGSNLALLALDVRYLMPRLRIAAPRVDPRLFWIATGAWFLLAFAAFYRSGYLSLKGAGFAEVYDLRAEIASRREELGVVFRYASPWSGAVFAPALVIAGLHRKRIIPTAAGIALAWCSYVVSANRLNYMAILPTIVGYLLLRRTRGRHIAIVMGGAFIALTLGLLGIDRVLQHRLGADLPPFASWVVFFRTFGNNGFLSAMYLDAFRNLPYGNYADTFLRAFPGPKLPAPIPVIAGASFTDIPGTWANAHLWADAYANMGYLGMAVSALFTAVVFWLYDAVGVGKPRAVATALLVVPASILANTTMHTALTSNGLLMLFPLLALWPGSEREPARG